MADSFCNLEDEAFPSFLSSSLGSSSVGGGRATLGNLTLSSGPGLPMAASTVAKIRAVSDNRGSAAEASYLDGGVLSDARSSTEEHAKFALSFKDDLDHADHFIAAQRFSDLLVKVHLDETDSRTEGAPPGPPPRGSRPGRPTDVGAELSTGLLTFTRLGHKDSLDTKGPLFSAAAEEDSAGSEGGDSDRFSGSVFSFLANEKLMSVDSINSDLTDDDIDVNDLPDDELELYFNQLVPHGLQRGRVEGQELPAAVPLFSPALPSELEHNRFQFMNDYDQEDFQMPDVRLAATGMDSCPASDEDTEDELEAARRHSSGPRSRLLLPSTSRQLVGESHRPSFRPGLEGGSSDDEPVTGGGASSRSGIEHRRSAEGQVINSPVTGDGGGGDGSSGSEESGSDGGVPTIPLPPPALQTTYDVLRGLAIVGSSAGEEDQLVSLLGHTQMGDRVGPVGTGEGSCSPGASGGPQRLRDRQEALDAMDSTESGPTAELNSLYLRRPPTTHLPQDTQGSFHLSQVVLPDCGYDDDDDDDDDDEDVDESDGPRPFLGLRGGPCGDATVAQPSGSNSEEDNNLLSTSLEDKYFSQSFHQEQEHSDDSWNYRPDNLELEFQQGADAAASVVYQNDEGMWVTDLAYYSSFEKEVVSNVPESVGQCQTEDFVPASNGIQKIIEDQEDFEKEHQFMQEDQMEAASGGSPGPAHSSWTPPTTDHILLRASQVSSEFETGDQSYMRLTLGQFFERRSEALGCLDANQDEDWVKRPSFGYIITSPEKREPFALIHPSEFSSRDTSAHSETAELSQADQTLSPEDLDKTIEAAGDRMSPKGDTDPQACDQEDGSIHTPLPEASGGAVTASGSANQSYISPQNRSQLMLSISSIASALADASVSSDPSQLAAVIMELSKRSRAQKPPRPAGPAPTTERHGEPPAFLDALQRSLSAGEQPALLDALQRSLSAGEQPALLDALQRSLSAGEQPALLDVLQRSLSAGELSGFDIEKYLRKADVSVSSDASVSHSTFNLTGWADNLDGSHSSQDGSAVVETRTSARPVEEKKVTAGTTATSQSVSGIKTSSSMNKGDTRRSSIPRLKTSSHPTASSSRFVDAGHSSTASAPPTDGRAAATANAPPAAIKPDSNTAGPSERNSAQDRDKLGTVHPQVSPLKTPQTKEDGPDATSACPKTSPGPRRGRSGLPCLKGCSPSAQDRPGTAPPRSPVAAPPPPNAVPCPSPQPSALLRTFEVFSSSLESSVSGTEDSQCNFRPSTSPLTHSSPSQTSFPSADGTMSSPSSSQPVCQLSPQSTCSTPSPSLSRLTYISLNDSTVLPTPDRNKINYTMALSTTIIRASPTPLEEPDAKSLDYLQPHQSKSLDHLQPHQSKSLDHLQPHQSKSLDHLQPHQSKSLDHLQPHQSKSLDHLQPHQSKSVDHLQPHQSKSVDHLQPHQSKSLDPLPPPYQCKGPEPPYQCKGPEPPYQCKGPEPPYHSRSPDLRSGSALSCTRSQSECSHCCGRNGTNDLQTCYGQHRCHQESAVRQLTKVDSGYSSNLNIQQPIGTIAGQSSHQWGPTGSISTQPTEAYPGGGFGVPPSYSSEDLRYVPIPSFKTPGPGLADMPPHGGLAPSLLAGHTLFSAQLAQQYLGPDAPLHPGTYHAGAPGHGLYTVTATGMATGEAPVRHLHHPAGALAGPGPVGLSAGYHQLHTSHQNQLELGMMGKAFSQPSVGPWVAAGLEELRSQVVVPEELRFPHACCVGIASQTSLSIFNPSERWQQVSITVTGLAIDGVKVDSIPYQWLMVKNKTILGPKSTEEQKLLLIPPQAGVYQFVLSVSSWPASAQTEVAARAQVFAKRVVLVAVAENPALEVDVGPSGCLDFGDLSGGSAKALPLKLLNRTHATVPVRLVISANASAWRCFTFSKSPVAMTAEGHMTQLSNPSVMNHVMHASYGESPESFMVWVHFHAPQKYSSSSGGLGPADEYSARVDMEMDCPGPSQVIMSIPLRARSGTARVHAPKDLQTVSLSAAPGTSSQQTLPLKNAGNIDVQLKLKSSVGDCFSVKPEELFLRAGEEQCIVVLFSAQGSRKIRESVLTILVLPSGPQYEVSLRGEEAPEHPDPPLAPGMASQAPPILSNKQFMAWGGVTLGRAVQQKLVLRNNASSGVQQLRLLIRGQDQDCFQLQSMFSPEERLTRHGELSIRPHEDVAVHLLFAPTRVACMLAKLEIKQSGARPSQPGVKFTIPLSGYGGTSNIILEDQRKRADGYVATLPGVAPGRVSKVCLCVRNTGSRAAFIKATAYADVQTRSVMEPGVLSLSPSQFVLKERTQEVITVLMKSTQREQAVCQSPGAALLATVCLFTGEEVSRQQFRRLLQSKPEAGRRVLSENSLLRTVNFNERFLGEEEVLEAYDLPQRPNEAQIFYGNMNKVLVSLMGTTDSSDSGESDHTEARQVCSRHGSETDGCFGSGNVSLDVLPVKGPQGPALRAPEAPLKAAASPDGPRDTWSLRPEQLLLTAPTINGAASTRQVLIQNHVSRELSFELSWPAHCLTITPQHGTIEPQCHLQILISPNPSLATKSALLPWTGNIYVQCDNQQKFIKVQIRRDLTLDVSAALSDGTLAALAPQAATPLLSAARPHDKSSQPPHTPHGPQAPLKIGNKTIVFPATLSGETSEAQLEVENGEEEVRWYLSSFAPPYVKGVDNSSHVYRATYTAFRCSRVSGTLGAQEKMQVPITFLPRDRGDYAQFWDMECHPVAEPQQKTRLRLQLCGTGVRSGPVEEPQEGDCSLVKTEASVKSRRRSDASAPCQEEAPGSGVYCPEDQYTFPATRVGQASSLKVNVRNNSSDTHELKFLNPREPFHIKHSTYSLRAQHYLKLPVQFKPRGTGRHSGRLLIQSETSGSLVIQLNAEALP